MIGRNVERKQRPAQKERWLRGWLLAPLLAGCAGSLGCGRLVASGSSLGANQGPPPAPEPSHNLLRNADFEKGGTLPWLTSMTDPAAGESNLVGGALCLRIDHPGANPWDAQLAHRQLLIEKGHKYQLDFRAWASAATRVRPKVGMAGPPYAEYWAANMELQTEPVRYRGSFTMLHENDPTAEFTLHMGGPLAAATPVTVCIDELYITDPQFEPTATERPTVGRPAIAVNQHGYLPRLPKLAVMNSDATDPLPWQLLTNDGKVALAGQTQAIGSDPHSGHSVHHIDFSDYQEPGSALVLRVGAEESHPFDISASLYSQLKYDALAYFYHNRSGIEIEMPFCGEQHWARPAGHAPDRAACAPDAGCDYTLDVSRGWYDAGDHGKYVVNGGISAWTLMNQYERALHLGTTAADFGDGRLQIPEHANSIPDLLDEAKWEVEFLVAMQVPEGQPLAGMAHHKMHDVAWTQLGLRPDQDTSLRVLRPPSTAATLNLAAAGAQAARLFRQRDRAFSVRALVAARSAFEAALKHPERYAPESDNAGGGPYNDAYVQDELYWAAAELYITTGDRQYLERLQSSPHHQKLRRQDGMDSALTWDTTDALGAISLAVVPSQLPQADRDRLRARLVALADKYLEHAAREGYGTPFKPGGAGYPWGSNSFVMTNAMVMALAFDFTGEARYLGGVAGAMNYVLGTNPLGQSYITGYGERPLKNPHHRFWARQARADFPPPPPGVLSGGPNSSLQDPHVRGAGLARRGCAPQQCFLDHIEAWSVNEVTINWNSPLAWVAAFLDEQGQR